MPVSAPRLASPVEAEIHIAPMIDVLLVLLVIFILGQAFGRQVLPAQLPPSAAVPGPGHQVVLDLSGSGFTLNGQPVPDRVLDAELRAIYAGRTAKVLFVRPGPGRTVGELVATMDRARAAGVAIVALLPVDP